MSGPAHRRGPPPVPAAIVQAKAGVPRGPVVPAALVQPKVLQAKIDRIEQKGDKASPPAPALPAAARTGVTIQARSAPHPSAGGAPRISFRLAGATPPASRVGQPCHAAHTGGVVQRAGARFRLHVADELAQVVTGVVFFSRPPVSTKVADEVKALNSKHHAPRHHVGHVIGWDLIARRYSKQVKGKTVKEIAAWLETEKYDFSGKKLTISLIEDSFGKWVNSHYKKFYAKNEFAQLASENMSAGGHVPVTKATYEALLEKRAAISDPPPPPTPEDVRAKKAYHKSMLNAPEGDLAPHLTLYEETWNSVYGLSPIRAGELNENLFKPPSK